MSKYTPLRKLLEMLKIADPERMARLENMGYDISTGFIHGTPKIFNEFDANKSKGMYGDGTYFSIDPEKTDLYGNKTIPVILKKGKYYQVEGPSLEEQGLISNTEELIKNANLSDAEKNKLFERIKKYYQTRLYANPFEDIKYYGYNNDTQKFGNELTKSGIMGYEKNSLNPSEELGDVVRIIPDSNNIKSIWAKGKGPGLLGGFAVMPNAPSTDMNPLPAISDLIKKYRKVQEPVADYVTETVSKPFGGADETTKLLNRILLDPTNVGALGGLVQALEFALPKKKEENQ